jgi:two-component system CheB/CheR fusion protein
MSEQENKAGSTTPRYYVGIGASAGGLEAITTFFRHMPVNTGMTFIIVQHLSPDYKSMMAELVGKVTSMPVHVIEDGVEPQPDHIYLIPPKHDLTFFHGRLLLEPQDRNKDINHLPIDKFLTTLAEDRGRFAVGIVLSGTGSDGTRGCRVIKEQGGLVMAQTVASAKFSGMPSSVISLGLADYILSADEMPEQLLRYTRHPMAGKRPVDLSLSQSENSSISRVFALLRSRTKVDFSFYKSPTIMRRIERRISICQVNDLDDYVDFLSEHPEEQTNLYKELLIGVTNFYRDSEVFDLLQNKVLPQYVLEKEREELRVWVAGCSTGEEAYTYCIILNEICEQHGLSIDVKVFATDIDQDALNKASVGIYPESIVADLPRPLLSKYFIHKDDQFHISRHIREMVVFARHDLIKDPPFTNIDIVSCRNLLIYLESILQRRIYDSFNFSVKAGGLLILGSSESLGDADAYFKAVDLKCKIFQSLGNRKPLLSSEHLSTSDGAALSNHWTLMQSKPSAERKTTDEARVLQAYVETVAGKYIPFAMVVNEDNELYQVMGDSRRFLNPISGRMTTNISELVVKELSVPIATGLKKVFKSQKDVVFTDISLRVDGKASKVNIAIKPFEVRRNLPMFAAIIVTENQAAPEDGEIRYDVGAETLQRIADMEQELQFTRESLQATIEELETSNEELQATNEELLASNEELQSTNEELQSVNEELFTVNSEFQGKISELSELNADLHNFMAASKVVSVFLDMELAIRRFTNNAKFVFNVIDHDIGRPFTHISHQIENVDLKAIIDAVLETGDTIEKQVKLETGDWYKLSVMPYLLNERVQAGIMIVMHEINTLIAAENEVIRLMRLRELSQTLSNVASWDWNLQDNNMVWSENVTDILDLTDMSDLAEFNDFIRFVHPEDATRFNKTVNDTIRDGGSYKLQHRIITANKEIKLVEQTGAKVDAQYEGGSHLLGVMTEIHESSD